MILELSEEELKETKLELLLLKVDEEELEE